MNEAQIPESCIAELVLTLDSQNPGLVESLRGELHPITLVAVRKLNSSSGNRATALPGLFMSLWHPPTASQSQQQGEWPWSGTAFLAWPLECCDLRSSPGSLPFSCVHKELTNQFRWRENCPAQVWSNRESPTGRLSIQRAPGQRSHLGEPFLSFQTARQPATQHVGCARTESVLTAWALLLALAWPL